MSDESPVRRRLSGAQILVEWWDTPTPEYHPEQHARWLAGGDPVAALRRYGDRVVHIHLKDVAAGPLADRRVTRTDRQ